VRYEWLSQYYWQDLDEVKDHATQRSGPKIMNAQTGTWATSQQNSGWPWPLSVYFQSPLKRGGLLVLHQDREIAEDEIRNTMNHGFM